MESAKNSLALETLNSWRSVAEIRAAYGANYDRLVETKTKWDPTNLFRMNKNIAPRTEEISADYVYYAD
jgi:Berberine and berberine like